jgi:hypothetical protein
MPKRVIGKDIVIEYEFQGARKLGGYSDQE